MQNNKKLVIIFGPQAVGKMTVGQELSKQTGLKLFHNHMTIELVLPFFEYKSKEGKRLINLFREEIFEAVAKSNLQGLIFTYTWALDDKQDSDYIKYVCDIFEKQNTEIYFVELEANQKIRLERNRTENRIRNKPSKKDSEWSEKDLLEGNEKYRLNSNEGEFDFMENYLKINNEKLMPEEVVEKIIEKFKMKKEE